MIQISSIIAISANQEFKNDSDFNVSNFNDFIIKPYSSDELVEKLIHQQSVNKIKVETMVSGQNKDSNDFLSINLTPVLSECMGDILLLNELITLFKKNN